MPKKQRLERWAFVIIRNDIRYKVSRLCTTDDCNQKKLELGVVGKVYNRGWKDGAVIRTAPITEILEGRVKTRFGVEYELGSKHPDFLAFEEAVKKGIPILRNWALGAIDDGSIYIQGNIGEYEGAQPNFRKKVVSQEGRIVTLYDGSNIFVDWFSTRSSQEFALFKVFGAKEASGRPFCGMGFEPYIFSNNWEDNSKGRGGIHYLTAQKAKENGIM